MTRSRLLVLTTAVVASALVLLLGGVLVTSPSTGSAGTRGPSSDERVLSGLPSSVRGTAAEVQRLEAAVRVDPANVRSLALLGLGYEQRWRETGDASFLPLAGRALGDARRLDPRDPLTIQGLGSLALTRHQFRRALQLGRLAARLAPASARSYGIVGDALVELGHYPQAFAAFQRMNDLKPSLAAYARASYARELTGDLSGSIAAMRLALDAAVGDREGYAWTAVQLGKLYWQRGDGQVAALLYRRALTIFPGYVYALDALAPVEASRGRLSRAIAFERRAAEAIPLPQFVAQLGDLYERAGKAGAARRQFATVRVIEKLLTANGIRTDLETALYRADHGMAPAQTVALARRARANRPSILGDDTLAWALARAGRCSEALEWSQRSLRLGTHDPLLFFHRGAIERCLGHRALSRAWLHRARALNPDFSIRWSPVAVRWVRS